jgi:pyruvate/2-oxoglutarate dehydrogenase complex dihydrolipoamide acyltransferase (E2) component
MAGSLGRPSGGRSSNVIRRHKSGIISDEDIHILKIPMPTIMESTEGKVIQWLKKEGESLLPGTGICRVQILNGIEIEIESPFQGVLADILVNTYVDVPTDETLCVLCDSQHAYMSYFERRREKAIESEKAEQALMDQAAQDADVDDIKATP